MGFAAGRFCLHSVLLATAFDSFAAPAAPLKSPWDVRPVALTDRAYTCPEPAHLPPTLTSNSCYTDAHHSVVDPEAQRRYKETTAQYQEAVRKIIHAADAYQTTGSRAAVRLGAKAAPAPSPEHSLEE